MNIHFVLGAVSISSTMQKSFCVLACLICAAHALGAQTFAERLRNTLDQKPTKVLNASPRSHVSFDQRESRSSSRYYRSNVNSLKTLSRLLLVLKPMSAFNSIGPSSHFSRDRRPGLDFHSTPVMSIAERGGIDGCSHVHVFGRRDFGRWVGRSLGALATSCAIMTGGPGTVWAEPPPKAEVESSTLAREVGSLIGKQYVDRTFNGVDMQQYEKQLDERGPLTLDEAMKTAKDLVKKIGDPEADILGPIGTGKFFSENDPSGVGLKLGVNKEGEVMIALRPYKKSAAAGAGLQKGDVVTKVNGELTKGLADKLGRTSTDVDFFSANMLGELGAILERSDVVDLEVKPASGGEPINVRLQKNFEIRDDPVEFAVFESGARDGGDVIYVKLTSFNGYAYKSMRDVVQNIDKKKASAFVLDLRENQKGLKEWQYPIAGLFFEKPVVSDRASIEGSTGPIYTRQSDIWTDLPMQVWINRNTEGAAEGLAATLRDNCRATLIGVPSFGKGRIQKVFPLSNDGVLIQTIGKSITPAGEPLDRNPLQPDLKIKFSRNLADTFNNQKESFLPKVGAKACVEPGAAVGK